MYYIQIVLDYKWTLNVKRKPVLETCSRFTVVSDCSSVRHDSLSHPSTAQPSLHPTQRRHWQHSLWACTKSLGVGSDRRSDSSNAAWVSLGTKTDPGAARLLCCCSESLGLKKKRRKWQCNRLYANVLPLFTAILGSANKTYYRTELTKSSLLKISSEIKIETVFIPSC